MKTTTMKTKLTIAALFAITAVFFLTCDNPVGLGAMLDLEGPLVEFSSPAPRQALLADFVIEGLVSDKSGVDRMLLTAERTIAVENDDETTYKTVTYAKQWRYENGKWEVSADSGASWAALGGAGPAPGRTVTNEAWSLPIDMRLNGKAEDGIYLFKIQAWDSGGFTGDSSTKTIVLIVDQYPPKVSVIDPYIYNRHSFTLPNTFSDLDLKALHDIANSDEGESRKSVNIGRFMTRDFNLKWQIDDEYDIGSIDIYFCDYDTNIDGLPDTPIDPNKTYYHYSEPLPKPNGLTRVPNLTLDPGQVAGKDGEILKKIAHKTTIMVVGVCTDVAGNSNNEKDENGDEEKILGYFVYWPKADEPWIEYPAKMDNPYDDGNKYFDAPNNTVDNLKDKVLMVYPEKSIKPAAYQAHGVSKVRYALYQCEEERDEPNLPTSPTNPIRLNGVKKQPTYYKSVNKPREFGDSKILSTNFTWEITAPSRPGYYLIVAIPYGPEFYSESDVSGRDDGSDADFEDDDIEKFTALFRVQDISFPEFLPGYPLPSATEPLFKFIGKQNGDPDFTTASDPGEIRISGRVDDAVSIESLLMVWINPASRNYSAMSQLRYFTDPAYKGWTDALDAPDGQTWPMDEGEYDDANPNKVWKITPTGPVEDPDTYRQVFTYDQVINLLDTLKIGIGPDPDHTPVPPETQKQLNPLKSQMFLLRAQNPDGKATVISYAPQGDAAVPTIKIKDVQVGGVTYEPSKGFTQIPQFLDADPDLSDKKIIVNGTWEEDSTEYLDNWTYFYNNMKFSINGVTIQRNAAGTDWVDGSGNALNGIAVVVDPATGAAPATEGTFTITATVGTESSTNTLKTSDLRDTLVVNASVRDYGGNPAEDGASWLIESDKLRFLRISSLADDQAYRAGQAIDIFIEFNKPVILKKIPARSRNPVLLVNATDGTTTTGTATYKDGQISEATRHYFTYTPAAGHNTDKLNVTGISIAATPAPLAVNATDWQNADYPFTFVHTNIEGKTEEIRLTRTATHVTNDPSRNGVEVTANGATIFARLVPVTNVPTDPDYIYTLGGGKAISVDTTAPTISSFTASPAGWHRAGVDLYITATFSENVKLGTTRPRLTLGYTNNNTQVGQTVDSADDVRVNNDQITFRYRVAAGDNTNGNPLRVTAFSGDILDIPENRMTAFTAATLGTNTSTYLYLDTTPPVVPTVTVWSGTAPANNAAPTGNALATSGNAAVALGNRYDENLFVRIAGSAGAENLGRLEYTLNGTNWTSLTSADLSATGARNIQINNNGDFTVRARQIDQAGNIVTANSGESYNITFNLDRGALISSINSFTPNGTYTYNTARQTDRVEIQVNFRKTLRFPANQAQTITLNVTGGTAGSNVVTYNPGANAVTTNQLTFAYNVANNHTTSGSRLNVTGITLTGIRDGTAATSPTVPAEALALPAAASNLGQLKEIYITTGGLTAGTPAFNNGSLLPAAGTGGIQTDGSYNTALTVTFNRPIYRNDGNITITQSATNYRVPAVLTEAQYNKYRDIANFNTYYTRGTNGYIGNATPANGTPDTSTKFVLAYNFNPASPAAGDQTTFTAAFRQAERIQLSVNSSAVRIVNTATTGQLIVDLAGANALQVPGAQYDIVLDANLVQDSLSNRSVQITATSPATGTGSIGEVAKPVIRVLKRQDTITVNTPNATTPRFTAAQPFTTTVRMDTRTPGANIYYNTNRADTTTAAVNWTSGAGPGDTTTPAAPTRPGVPTNTGTQYTAEITIGNTTAGATPTIANVQGLRWHVRAVAYKDSTYSTDSEEMAYRTVLTYAVTNMSTNQGQNFTSGTSDTAGNQVWIRGGDGISVSSTPGFPLTWEDNFDTLKADRKRAGTRLLTLTATPGTNLNTSTWRWVTWEVNVDTYFDIIMGYDPNNTNGTNANVVNVVTQYGPRQWAMQRAGWSSFKNESRILPGKHRWMVVTNAAQESKGSVNFTPTFQARPAMTGNGDVTWTP